ncbi:MAG: hypothetical protein V3R78_12575 [Thermodesulfobacteriota bacterium]
MPAKITTYRPFVTANDAMYKDVVQREAVAKNAEEKASAATSALAYAQSNYDDAIAFANQVQQEAKAARTKWLEFRNLAPGFRPDT